MESYGGGGGGGTRTSASSRRPCTAAAAASRAGSGAFVYDGMRATPLSTANFTRSLRKAASFAHKNKKLADAPPPRRALSSSKENSSSAAAISAVSVPEPGSAAASGPWEPTPTTRRPRRSPSRSRCRSRSTAGGTADEAGAGKTSSCALREMMAPRRKEEPEAEEAAHQARVLTARLLQWRFANARLEKATARAAAAAENRLFYTWLRVAELRGIQASKRVVAQRRRQKLRLARLLRPQLPLLASWEPLAEAHDAAAAGLARALSAACTGVPLAAGARADVDALREALFSCVDTVSDIEAITGDTFYATAGAASGALGELARTIQQEMECLQEATQLSSIVTALQMKEVSLRANLMQAKQRIDLGLGLRLGPATQTQPPLATSGWCF